MENWPKGPWFVRDFGKTQDGDAVITKEDGLLAEAALAKATGAA